MPLPQPQEPVYDHLGRIVRVDFVYRSLRIVIEADGFAFHSDPLARARDRQRRNRLEIEGWVVLTFTWEDVMFDPHSVVRDVAAAISKRS